MAERPITNGEIWIPALFLGAGLLLFAYFGLVKKQYAFGGAMIFACLIGGFLLSRVAYSALEAAGKTPVPEGSGQPIQTSRQGGAAASAWPKNFTPSMLKLLADKLIKDLEARSGSKVAVQVAIRQYGNRQILKEDFVFPGGKAVTRYEGLAGNEVASLTCDFGLNYPVAQVQKSCESKFAAVFGQQ
jgi:hypothetical protein